MKAKQVYEFIQKKSLRNTIGDDIGINKRIKEDILKYYKQIIGGELNIVNLTDPYIILYLGIKKSDAGLVKYILDKNIINPNIKHARYSNTQTFQELSIYARNLQILKLLLDYGYDYNDNIHYMDNVSLLDYTIQESIWGLNNNIYYYMSLLLIPKVDVNFKNGGPLYNTIKRLMTRYGKKEEKMYKNILELLFKYGAKIKTKGGRITKLINNAHNFLKLSKDVQIFLKEKMVEEGIKI